MLQLTESIHQKLQKILLKQEKQILSLFQDSLLQNHFSLQRLKKEKSQRLHHVLTVCSLVWDT